MKKIKIKIPATVANLGSGFDSFGAALNLYNEIEITDVRGAPQQCISAAAHQCRKNKVRIDIEGEGKETLPKNERNIVWKAMKKVFDSLHLPRINALHLTGQAPYTLHLTLTNNIPLASGLGSSAAATLGGLLAANKICYNKLSAQEILKLAIELEGHPDNIVPAFAGGFCICFNDVPDIRYSKIEVPADLKAVVCVPEFEFSTKFARKILPKKVLLSDAVFNISRSAIFIKAILSKKYDLLQFGMQDALHQSYRGKYIPAYKEVIESAKKAGAFGSAISGAGPSIVAISSRSKSQGVAELMEEAFWSKKVKSRSFILNFVKEGAKIS